MDVLLATLLLIMAFPILMMIAILIKFDSPGPVLYRPVMIGKNGRRFSLFRFRTRLAHNTEPRLTRVGRLIRTSSLDHLPMLINLLKGDLTIIGPRPMEIDVVDLQDPLWQRYFQVKPGLFNYAILKLGKLWTSSRVRHPSLNQELELEYREQQSAAVDVQLVMQFLRALIASRGNVKARCKPDPEVEKRVSKP